MDLAGPIAVICFAFKPVLVAFLVVVAGAD